MWLAFLSLHTGFSDFQMMHLRLVHCAEFGLLAEDGGIWWRLRFRMRLQLTLKADLVDTLLAACRGHAGVKGKHSEFPLLPFLPVGPWTVPTRDCGE